MKFAGQSQPDLPPCPCRCPFPAVQSDLQKDNGSVAPRTSSRAAAFHLLRSSRLPVWYYGMDASRFSANIGYWPKEGTMSLGLLAIDLGKRSFHIHGIDSDGVIISRKTSRSKLIETIEELAPETIAMEACASAHYSGRRFVAAGHRVLLINPRFVKPFVKGSKNDTADAEGIYEAATRPTMRFVLGRTKGSSLDSPHA